MNSYESAVLVTVIVASGLFGLAIGSFLNVVIYRVPIGKSIVSPPSACTTCGTPIRGFDNIPVLSWLILRGRCRTCKAPISARYPLIELGTGLLFVAVGWKFGPYIATATSVLYLVAAIILLIAFLYLAAIAVALAGIDLETHKLPDVIVLPSYVVAIVLLSAAALLHGTPGLLLPAAIGLVAMFAAYFIMAFAYPGGMGFGDVKLAGVLGAYLGWLGWGSLIVGAFAAFVLGGLFSVGLLIARRANRKSGIPFGPWMLLGAFVGIFAGDRIWSSYLGFVGLA